MKGRNKKDRLRQCEIRPPVLGALTLAGGLAANSWRARHPAVAEWDGLVRRSALASASWLLLLGMALPVAAEPVRTVLMVYGENRLLPAISIFDEHFRLTVQKGTGQPVEFLTEFLDVGRFPEDRYDTVLSGFLRDKYQGRSVDFIVAGGPTALKFLLRHREELHPGTPMVYAAVTTEQLKALGAPPEMAGVTIDSDPLPTLELALRLHPQARRLVLVSGTSAWDREWENPLHEAIPLLSRQVQAEFLAGLSIEDLLGRLRMLPEDAVVFVPSFIRDGAGRSFVNRDAVARIASAAPVPVYGPYSTYVGAGIVGGYMPPFEAIGQQAGEIVLRLLNGEAPSALPLSRVQSNDYILDWRQMRRFGIEAKALPQGSILKFREPTFWEVYCGSIVAILAVAVLQAALIAALLLERRRRRQTRADLLRSEKRVSLAANMPGVGMWLWDIPRDDIWASPQGRVLCDIEEAESIDFERFLRSLHPSDRKTMRNAVENALVDGREFVVQCRVVPRDGEVRWVSVRGQGESIGSGRPDSIAWVSIDVTARKVVELEAEQHRNELLRMARIGLLGQLSGSIAHELSQPLGSILANAQAAQRLMRRETVDLEEIRDIFTDIVEEDRRAVEVIRRLRSLFNRGEQRRQSLDLSEVAGEALKLVNGDLMARHVTLLEELATDLPAVQADRVQLQQVLLNLIVNACDAMAGQDPADCKLTVRTGQSNEEQVTVEVVDTGKGLDPAVASRLLEPFFTTKRHGMGMGLAICRSIVEAHEGQLSYANNPEGGATFRISLPVKESKSR